MLRKFDEEKLLVKAESAKLYVLFCSFLAHMMLHVHVCIDTHDVTCACMCVYSYLGTHDVTCMCVCIAIVSVSCSTRRRGSLPRSSLATSETTTGG